MSDSLPVLWVVTEREIGSPLFAVAIFGVAHFRFVPVPKGIDKLPANVEEKLISFVVRRHFKKTNGVVQCFGRILGYTYLRSADERWSIATNGEIVARYAPPVRPGKYTLTLKGERDISFLFRGRRK
jgi:hypothetical protein